MRNFFIDGFIADENTRYFIETTLGDISAAQIEQILNDPDNDENAALLLDLVVSPAPEICRQLEEILEGTALADGQVTALRSFLPAPLTTCLSFPDDRGTVSFSLPSASLDRFLAQLHLDRAVDPALCRVLRQQPPGRLQYLEALTMLRRARLRFSPEQTDFLVKLVTSTAGQAAGGGTGSLELMIDVLGRHPQAPDAFAALKREQENCRKQVAATVRLEQQLSRKNMETLMMQRGGSAVMADKQALFSRIGRLDTIAWTVFGRPLAVETEPAVPETVSFLFEKNHPRG